MKVDLKDAYDAGKLVLFAGAGVSANLGVPTWAELIGQIATELGYDPVVFSSYGEPLALAEYYRHKKETLGPLRSWMDREWHHGVDVKQSEIHQLIAQGKFA